MQCHSCPRFRKHKTRQYDGVCTKFWCPVLIDDLPRRKESRDGTKTIKRNVTMKIEFTKEDLDYLAEKIAKIMMRGKLPTINPDKKISEMSMSIRLSNIMEGAGLGGYTIRQLSEVRVSEWKKFRNMGPKTYAELMQIFAESGCSFGDRRFDYNRATYRYTII